MTLTQTLFLEIHKLHKPFSIKCLFCFIILLCGFAIYIKSLATASHPNAISKLNHKLLNTDTNVLHITLCNSKYDCLHALLFQNKSFRICNNQLSLGK